MTGTRFDTFSTVVAQMWFHWIVGRQFGIGEIESPASGREISPREVHFRNLAAVPEQELDQRAVFLIAYLKFHLTNPMS